MFRVPTPPEAFATIYRLEMNRYALTLTLTCLILASGFGSRLYILSFNTQSPSKHSHLPGLSTPVIGNSCINAAWRKDFVGALQALLHLRTFRSLAGVVAARKLYPRQEDSSNLEHLPRKWGGFEKIRLTNPVGGILTRLSSRSFGGLEQCLVHEGCVSH